MKECPYERPAYYIILYYIILYYIISRLSEEKLSTSHKGLSTTTVQELSSFIPRPMNCIQQVAIVVYYVYC